MDNSKCSCSASRMCASIAAVGRFGISNSAVCVDVMIVLLAVLTRAGFFALRLFLAGSFGVMYVSFAPVSAMSFSVGGLSVVCDVAD